MNMKFDYLLKQGVNQNLIEENYIRFVLGISLKERWFVKKKYNQKKQSHENRFKFRFCCFIAAVIGNAIDGTEGYQIS